MLLFVTSSHCHFCTRMKNETFLDSRLAPVFPQLFETVAVHADQDQALVQKLGVRMFPTTILISPKGTLLGRLDGFVPPEQMSARLNPLLNKHYASLAAQSAKIAESEGSSQTIARTVSARMPAPYRPMVPAPIAQPRSALAASSAK